MEEFTENSVLKVLHRVFIDYSGTEYDYIPKIEMIRFFYDYKIIDTCGYNIFHLNSFLNQLNPDEDEITLKMFLVLIFYIYQMQCLPEEEKSITNLDDITINDVNKISEDRLQITSTKNIITIILNAKERKDYSFIFISPDLNEEDIRYICTFELLDFLSQYMHSIEKHIFDKYSSPLPNKSSKSKSNNINKENELKCVNITQINTLIFELPIFKNFNCEEITKYLCLFIPDVSKSHFQTLKTAFDERLDQDKITEILESLNICADEINFTFSSIVILLTQFALKLKSSEGREFTEAIQFLFEEEFKLVKDNANLTEQLQEEQEEEPDIDYLPESETLNQVKKGEIGEAESDFIEQLLMGLDKILPECDKNILAYANDVPQHNNKLSSNPYVYTPAKFPLERLQVEVEEEKAEQLLQKENRQIDKARKPKKRNARDAPPKEIYMDELPKKENYELKYRGKPIVNTLTYRLIKKTYKDILPNSNVYPVLIREVLIIPKGFPSAVKEIITESYKDQIKGHLEIAIMRLEKAENQLHIGFKTDEIQCALFFELTYAYLYESLNYNIEAFKYLNKAKIISDKLLAVDPDRALVYCYLGALFLKLSEFEWSIRCFKKAKEIREETIGGDTLDTAAVYNNLGVVSFYLESFLPAKHYFQLAYEITKKILGLRHTRTLQIKNNITKLSQLSFNKTIQFKTLSKYPASVQTIQNPKKKKGKR